ncbi:hypothetical protein F3J41_05765 [Pantoea sp. Ap-870]|nr:hypothetical protein [Pantoea sp. Ap-870]
MIIGMIIILLRFDGGSTEEEHDIAHIASSITLPAPRVAGFFFAPSSAAHRYVTSGNPHAKSASVICYAQGSLSFSSAEK